VNAIGGAIRDDSISSESGFCARIAIRDSA
jgi:hypothetical protein